MSMQGFLKKDTATNVTILMVDSSDHVTGKTGLTLTIYATKAAGTPGAITPTVTELDSTNVKGIYKLALTSSHIDTLGELQLHITASGADPTDVKWQVSTYLPGEAATLQADQAVNATKWAGGTIPAPNVTGVPIIDLKYILGTVLTETAGQIAAAFKQFFDVASPTGNMKAITNVVTATNLTNAPTNGDFTATMKASINTEADTALADYDAPTHTELTNELATADDATLAAIAALNNLSQADVRSAVGLATANLDTQLSAIDDYIDTEVAAIKAKTDNLPSDPADESLLEAAIATVLADTAGIATLLSRLSSARAGYLDNLSAGAVALQSSVDDLEGRLTATRANNLDNLDALISSRLAAASYTTPPTANQNADALLDRANAIETGVTPRQAMRLELAAAAGKLSGAETDTVVIRNAVADTKDRITATVDENGNRLDVTVDVS